VHGEGQGGRWEGYERAGEGAVGDVGEGCVDGVLTVVEAVLSGRDMLSLRSNGRLRLCPNK